MPADLRSITDFADLIAYLRDELDWPVEDYLLDQLTFEYDADELGLKDEEAEKLKDGTIRQLRPLPGGQPFGIFFVEFGQSKLPVVVLRRILNALVIKKRNSANPADRQRWDAADILFISAFGASEDREIAFAHFHKDPDTTELPILRVLGWDGSDTPLKTQHVAGVLKNRLHWPENAADQDAWRKLWRGAFRHRLGHVIKTSSDLADALAGFARKIRDAATTIMAHESEAKGQLRKLHQAFKTSLIHDLTEADFADTYAQTVTYGLLTAAISKTPPDAAAMAPGEQTALTQDDITAMVPVTNPFLKEMLQEFLKVGGRKGGVDFDELGINEVVELLRGDETDLPAILRDFGNRKPGEDPVIHFYEHFLAAYNKKLRIQRGVFYTPQPVVSYIVRSVHELLQTEFGLEDGLASTVTWGEFIQKSKLTDPQSEISLPDLSDDPSRPQFLSENEPFVQILDPATGTATFPVEVIDVIYKHLKERWRLADSSKLPGGSPHFKSFTEYWNHYVPNHLLPRLHGYELMMAPYAIAHMKIGLKLAETGYTFATEERARIYLTNALEPKLSQLPTIGYEALAHEAAAVNEIKWKKRFTVVIGNPPYSLWSQNLNANLRAIVDPYRFVNGEPIKERGALQFEKILQDDYVKFFRLSQVQINNSGCGVLGLITNHSFTENPTLRGMRSSLLDSFQSIFSLNLHGNSSKKERNPDGSSDENVFDIKQGVAIFHGIQFPTTKAQTRHCGDLWGTRESKYTTLSRSSLTSASYNTFAPATPFLLFKASDSGFAEEYEGGWKIADMFDQGSMGIVTARDHVSLSFDTEPLLCTATEFRDSPLSNKAVCEKLDIPEKKGWDVAKARALIKKETNLKSFIQEIDYRPFNTRKIFYHRSLVWGMSWPTMQHVLGKKNIGLSTTRSIETGEFQHVFASQRLIGHHFVSLKEVNYLFPLWLYPGEDALSFRRDCTPNFKPEFLKALALKLELHQSGADSLPADLTPEDIFHYIYAVFHSPGYRSRYAEFLKIDFPRLPLTGNLELFRELSRLGGELVALHLLEFDVAQAFLPVLPKEAGKNAHLTYAALTEFIGPSQLVLKPGWTDGTVWLDSGGKKAATTPGTSGFHGVPENVWNFHIGGYQVCAKWLKDRKGRTLTDEDIAHYHKIVIALSHTIRLMAEIDQVIETHGGWPGAFQSVKSPQD